MAGTNRIRTEAGPPRWAEAALERLLSPPDRQTVIGDLREEYAEAVLPERGRLQATFWYVGQAASLAQREVFKESGMRVALFLASLFSVLCCCWLVVMESILRHPGYVARAGFDAGIALVPLAAIAALTLGAGSRLNRWLRFLGSVPVLIAVWVVVRDARSPHFEGFALVVSLALGMQGVLMLTSLGSGRGGPRAMEGTR